MMAKRCVNGVDDLAPLAASNNRRGMCFPTWRALGVSPLSSFHYEQPPRLETSNRNVANDGGHIAFTNDHTGPWERMLHRLHADEIDIEMLAVVCL